MPCAGATWTLASVTALALGFACPTSARSRPTPEKPPASQGSAPATTGLLPDLVARLAAPESARPGDDIGPRIHLAVKNVGGAPASGTRDHTAGYMVDLTLGRDEILPVGFKAYSPHYSENVLLQGGRVSKTVDIAPAVTQRYPVGAGIPADVAPGLYFLCAYVDPGNAVPESNERNNVTCASLRITPPPQVDDPRTDRSAPGPKPPAVGKEQPR